MEQLRSLQDQAFALRMMFDEAIKGGKNFEDVKELYLKLKDIEKKVYERKISLKRED